MLSVMQDMAIKKISAQFPDVPEGRLMAAVICQAVRDAVMKRDDIERSRARLYLSGRMEAAEICGVDSDWIRTVVHSHALIELCDGMEFSEGDTAVTVDGTIFDVSEVVEVDGVEMLSGACGATHHPKFCRRMENAKHC
ncbi:MAG: hypothetical protein GY938_01030 [Ketobacter sp.]|nr:hypothetical protein [Ketobacter sp.]